MLLLATKVIVIRVFVTPKKMNCSLGRRGHVRTPTRDETMCEQNENTKLYTL